MESNEAEVPSLTTLCLIWYKNSFYPRFSYNLITLSSNKQIPTSNYIIHEAQCEKMQAKLKAEAELKEQLEFERLQYEEYKKDDYSNEEIMCDVCKKQLDLGSLDNHECVCPHCHISLPSTNLHEHLEECENNNGSHENDENDENEGSLDDDNLLQHLESVHHPKLTKEQIENLPTIVYKEPQHSTTEEEKCIICMEKFISEQKLRFLTCMHRYHVDCIDPWLEQNSICPKCKIEVKI